MTPEDLRGITSGWLRALLLSSPAVASVDIEPTAPDSLWVRLADGQRVILSIEPAS